MLNTNETMDDQQTTELTEESLLTTDILAEDVSHVSPATENYDATNTALMLVGGITGGFLFGLGTLMLLPYLPAAAGLMAVMPAFVPVAPVVTMAGSMTIAGSSAAGAAGGIKLSSCIHNNFWRPMRFISVQSTESVSPTSIESEAHVSTEIKILQEPKL